MLLELQNEKISQRKTQKTKIGEREERPKLEPWCGGSAASNGGSWWPSVVVGGGEGGVRVLVALTYQYQMKENSG